jgi:hypothetical protein
VLTPIFGGCFSGVLAESSREMALAREPQTLGDARQLHLRLGQHLLRAIEFHLHHVVMG